ncbi:MAG: hypothetical protein R3B68_16950 [Phycisphaerales bacterium]
MLRSEYGTVCVYGLIRSSSVSVPISWAWNSRITRSRASSRDRPTNTCAFLISSASDQPCLSEIDASGAMMLIRARPSPPQASSMTPLCRWYRA